MVATPAKELTDAELDELEKLLDEAEKMQATEKMFTFVPYPKQREFMNYGSKFGERYLRAGNQNGKTITAACEVSYHLTGFYPSWWTGKVFTTGIRAWCAGVNAQVVRDAMQKHLCGEPGEGDGWGSGMIPKDLFVKKPSLSHGISNAFDTIWVKHKSGKVSSLTFKSYEQGRAKFQSETLDLVWLDEEPPQDIYSECVTRLMVRKGAMLVTFTPLGGGTALVTRFMENDPGSAEYNPNAIEVSMTIMDAEHISAEDRDKIIQSWPEHEREARAYGLPYLGSGAVFEGVKWSDIVVPLMLRQGQVYHKDHGILETKHWTKLWAIDFGIGHAFGAVLMAHDRDNDTIIVLAELAIKDGLPAIHAARMKSIAANVPVAWPHDGNNREKSSGAPLADIYRKEGLKMLPRHATFAKGGYDTEAGVLEMLTRMRDGPKGQRFFVSEECKLWQREFHSYYRKDGLIVKKNDDLLSATRIGVMQIRSAQQVGMGDRGVPPRSARDQPGPVYDPKEYWGM